MLIALRQANMKVEEEVALPVHFRGLMVGHFMRTWSSKTASSWN